MFHRITLLLLTVFCLAADSPSTAPSQPEWNSLTKGLVRFRPPAEPWILMGVVENGDGAAYKAEATRSILRIACIRAIAPKTELNREVVKASVLNELRKKQTQQGLTFVTPPTLENDDRFLMRITESFRKGDGIATQWHFYRTVGPHQVVVAALTQSEEPQELEQIKQAAEAVALSFELIPRGQKPPPPPRLSDEPEPDPAAIKAEISAAQSELDQAIAGCDQQLAGNAEYQAARRKADAAEARLKALREKIPVDRDAVAEASAEWIKAKGVAEKIRQDAHARDPAVGEARRKLNEAKAKSK